MLWRIFDTGLNVKLIGLILDKFKPDGDKKEQ